MNNQQLKAQVPRYFAPFWKPRTLFLVLSLLLAYSQAGFAGKDGEGGGHSSAPPQTSAPSEKAPTQSYESVIRFLSDKSHTSPEEIDEDLHEWIQADQLTVAQLTEFLTHYYFFSKARPHPIWSVELHNLKVVAQSAAIFDEIGVFFKMDPLEVHANPAGMYRLAKKNDAKNWRGSFKTVHRVILANDPSRKIYALSRVMKDLRPDENESHDVAVNELRIIRAIHSISQGNPVIGLLNFDRVHYSPNSKRVLFLSPFFNRGDGYERSLNTGVELADQVLLTEELLKGLDFLHHAGIVHRDIKPSNILLQRDDSSLGGHLHAVLADFGTAYQDGQLGIDEILKSEDHLKTTYQYLAPETVEKFALRHHQKTAKMIQDRWTQMKLDRGLSAGLQLRWIPTWTAFETDRASDLWSLGLSFLEIFSRQKLNSRRWILKHPARAFQPEDFLTVEQYQVNDALAALEKPPLNAEVSPKLLPVLKCLLRVNPAERCSTEKALARLNGTL